MSNSLQFKCYKENFPEAEFLWRYIGLHKFFSFIQTGNLSFSRLDTFEDPLESASKAELSQYRLYQGVKDLTTETVNARLGEDAINDLFTFRDNPVDNFYPSLKARQRIRYATCWYMHHRESIAMWNLYSNPESVVLKIKPEVLIKAIENNLSKNSLAFPDVNMLADVVEYHDFLDYDYLVAGDYVDERCYSFRKDISYHHENEFRIVLFLSQERVEKHLQFPIGNAEDLSFEIITHPKMENCKRISLTNLFSKKISEKFRKSGLLFNK